MTPNIQLLRVIRSFRVICVPLFTISWLIAAPAHAFDPTIDHWRFQTSLYTKHFDDDPDHDNTQQLINFEAWRADDWHAGLAFFDNSFGQSSQYLYVGKAWELGKPDGFYWRVTAGLLHGYKDEYEDKIPLNGLGVAPAIVPTLGFRYRRVFAEYQQLGLAAGMVTFGVSFGHKTER